MAVPPTDYPLAWLMAGYSAAWPTPFHNLLLGSLNNWDCRQNLWEVRRMRHWGWASHMLCSDCANQWSHQCVLNVKPIIELLSRFFQLGTFLLFRSGLSSVTEFSAQPMGVSENSGQRSSPVFEKEWAVNVQIRSLHSQAFAKRRVMETPRGRYHFCGLLLAFSARVSQQH